jgi:hypothetical protein
MAGLLARRDLLLAAGGTVLAAAALPSSSFAWEADDDPAFLRSAIEYEQIAATAYQRAAPQLGGIARLFRNQDRDHAAALVAALRRLGGTPPQVDVAGRLGSRSRPRDRRAAAEELIKLENGAVAAYVDAHGTIRDARLMQLVSSILGDHAQHLVALRDVAGQQEVPTAFETGGG